jgi:hypothetical protein
MVSDASPTIVSTISVCPLEVRRWEGRRMGRDRMVPPRCVEGIWMEDRTRRRVDDIYHTELELVDGELLIRSRKEEVEHSCIRENRT